MHRCDHCGDEKVSPDVIEALRKRVKELEEQVANTQELALAYDAQFREMTKEIDNGLERIALLETEGLKIMAERDAIITFSRDVIKDLKGGTYDKNTETNTICETQNPCQTI
jgi:hypothetical protein